MKQPKILRFVVSTAGKAAGLNFTVAPSTFEVPELLGVLRFGPKDTPTGNGKTYPL